MEEVNLHNENLSLASLKNSFTSFNIEDQLQDQLPQNKKNKLPESKSKNFDLKGKGNETVKSLNVVKKKKKETLFFKILFFQFIISSIVFFILLTLKKTNSTRYAAICSQLNVAVNEGPKFYDSINKTLEGVKKYGLNSKKSTNIESGTVGNEGLQNKLENTKSGEVDSKKPTLVNQNLAVPVSNSLNSSCNVENKDDASEKVVDDCLEKCSSDDGDLFFFDFVPPIQFGKWWVSSNFGPRNNPLNNKSNDFHLGVDIVVPVGTPIFSIANGVVKCIGNSKKSGNYMIIDHDFGYESRFAHCSELLKKKGDRIKKGEKIALVGQTGAVTGPHLHMGLKKDGKWLDPKVVFPKYSKTVKYGPTK